MKLSLFTITFISGLLLAGPVPAEAMHGSSDPERISREDGLGHNQVECIFQDSDGFIWFGTRNGLSRYDGFEIVNFTHNMAPGSISGNRILSIIENTGCQQAQPQHGVF